MISSTEAVVNQVKINLDQLLGGVAGNNVAIIAHDFAFEARGFVVKSATDEVLCCIAWGSGKTLESVCMAYKLTSKTMSVKTLFARSASTRPPEFWDAASESFLQGIFPKLKEKVRRKKNNITGGRASTTARLEAWPRTRKAPADKFEIVRNVLFPDSFIELARHSNVTYK